MVTAHQLKQERTKRVNDLFTSCAVFWAFSNEQFEQNKTPLQEGEKYVSIGAGGFLPKGNFEGLKKGLKEIDAWFAKAVNECKATREQYILDELINHEAWYTGDITDTLHAIGKGFTKAEVLKVYSKHRDQYSY
jgi:hypothetical protein